MKDYGAIAEQYARDVVSGEVGHRDFVLTTQEKEWGDCMMVCVSRAACPLLVLDA